MRLQCVCVCMNECVHMSLNECVHVCEREYWLVGLCGYIIYITVCVCVHTLARLWVCTACVCVCVCVLVCGECVVHILRGSVCGVLLGTSQCFAPIPPKRRRCAGVCV